MLVRFPREIAPMSGRFRLYPRYEKSRPEHIVAVVACGYCHEPVLPFGSLLLFDTHLAINLEEGSFVLVNDPDLPDIDGAAVKFLRRAADGTRKLVSNQGSVKLGARATVQGTLVAVYLPEKAAAGAASELDSKIRACLDEALAREAARRQRVSTDAVSRWGKPIRA